MFPAMSVSALSHNASPECNHASSSALLLHSAANVRRKRHKWPMNMFMLCTGDHPSSDCSTAVIQTIEDALASAENKAWPEFSGADKSAPPQKRTSLQIQSSSAGVHKVKTIVFTIA